MGSSMKQIRRLTWRVMWIRIGKEVPLIGGALQGDTLGWYQISLYQGYGAQRSSEALVCCNGRTNSWCVDEAISQSEVWVLQGEAWCSLDRGSLQREVMRPRVILTWWEDWVPSMVRCKGWAILSWWEDLVPSMSDVSAEPFWCDCRIGSYMIRYKCWMPFLEWRHLVSYQEYSVSDWEPFWRVC